MNLLINIIMGKIRQTKFSGNNYWTNVLFHNPQGPGSNAATAFDISVDDLTNHEFNSSLTWVKFTAPYTDAFVFWLYAEGLFSIPTSLSDYKIYASDGTTPIDFTGNADVADNGSGPDFEGRQGHSAFFNYSFQSGETYYVTFVPPFAGTYGIGFYGD